MRLGSRQICALAIIATALCAQTAPADDQDFVITSKRESEARALRRQVDAITDQIGFRTPIARHQAPVCIAAGGLARAESLVLADRMIEVAQTVGIPTANGKCQPTILVLFPEDSGAEVERLLERRHALVSDLSSEQVRALKKQVGPVRSWSTTEVRGRTGEPLLQTEQGGVPVLKVNDPSRIVTPIRRDIGSAVIFIDRKAVAGKSIRQVADYAAMRVFAQTRPPESAAAETILSLFDAQGAAPRQLTVFDAGYLRGLYHHPAAAFPGAQKGLIAKTMADERAAEVPAAPADSAN